jgi:DNA-binding transcriptional ArsR family regulator
MVNVSADVPMVPGSSVPLSEVKAELFKALAHPARIRALEVLADGERSVSDLQPLVGIESSHLSQQLGVLRRAGLVVTRKDGSSVIYALRDPLAAELLLVAKRFLLSSLTETSDLLADLRASVAVR